MKHIITHFFEKHNPVILILRLGLSYSAILAITVIFLLSGDAPHYEYAELVLVGAIAAFLQTLIGCGFLRLCTKKDKS